jgi:hypothetical protein
MSRNTRTGQRPIFKTSHDSVVHTNQFAKVAPRTQDYFWLCTGEDEEGNPCWHALNATLSDKKATRHEKRTGHGMERHPWEQGERLPTQEEEN